MSTVSATIKSESAVENKQPRKGFSMNLFGFRKKKPFGFATVKKEGFLVHE